MTSETDPGPESDLEQLVAATEGLQPWRRVFHALTGLVFGLGPVAAGFSRSQAILVFAVILSLQVALDLLRLRVESVQKWFFRLVSFLASPREAKGIASSTYFTLGTLLCFALFPMGIASAAVLVLAFADPAAGTVGRLRGRHRFGEGSVEGSAAFFVAALAVLLMAVDWPAALVAALAATLVEITPRLGDDNLKVPLTTGAVLWIMLSGVV